MCLLETNPLNWPRIKETTFFLSYYTYIQHINMFIHLHVKMHYCRSAGTPFQVQHFPVFNIHHMSDFVYLTAGES